MNQLDPKEVRRKLYDQYKEQFATAPIRLFSKIDVEARRILTENNQEYDGYSGAIGDINLSSFPKELQDKLFYNRREEINAVGEDIIKKEKPVFTSYDYMGTGFDSLKDLWMEKYLIYSEDTKNFHPYIFYGGMNAFNVTMKAISRFRDPTGTKRLQAFLPTPSFPPFFFQMERFYTLNFYPTAAKSQFKLQAEEMTGIDPAMLDLVYLTVISNPTAMTFEAEELRELLKAIIAKRPDSFIVLDAVYLRTLPSKTAESVWRVMTDVEFMSNVVIIESLSKTYGRTGLRSGVVFVNNQDLEREINNLMQNELAGISYAMQIESAGILMLVKDETITEMALDISRRRKTFLGKYLDKYKDCFLPLNEQRLIPDDGDWQGGMYAFVELHEHLNPIDFFIETGIASIPGNAFFGTKSDAGNFIRISFGLEDVKG